MHKKYTVKNGKPYGPYFYENKRVGEKVVTTYVGKTAPKNINFKVYTVAIITVLILAGLVLFYQSSPTGRAVLSVDSSYNLGEILDGNLKLSLKAGEFLPASTIVSVRNGDQTVSIPISELISSGIINASYYVENADINGFGEGYGILGSKKYYPEIGFTILVSESSMSEQNESNQSISPGASGGSEQESENETVIIPSEPEPTQNESQEIVDETVEPPVVEPSPTETETPTETPVETSTPTETETETPTESTPDSSNTDSTDTTPSSNANENSQNNPGSDNAEAGAENSQASSNSASSNSNDNSNSQSKNSESSNSESSSDSSSQSSSESSSSSSSDSSSSITGSVISEDEFEVIGKTSKDNAFTYNLEQTQTASLVSGSVNYNGSSLSDNVVDLEFSGNVLSVNTDYSVDQQGFGIDYLGDDLLDIVIDLSKFNINVSSEVLEVGLYFDNTTILEVDKVLEINQPILQSNLTLNETLLNETILNETLLNMTLINTTNISTINQIVDIPTIRISQNSSVLINLNDYFEGAEYYEFNVSDILFELNESYLNLTSPEGFSGARKGKVLAISGNESLESNEFNILVSSSISLIITSRDKIVVGEPVRWIKNISLENPENLTIVIPGSSGNITVKKIESDEESPAVAQLDGKLGSVINARVIAEVDTNKDFSLIKLIKNMFSRITGRAIQEINASISGNETQIEIKIADNATDYIVEYYTPSPQINETLIQGGKQVIVSSSDELHYSDVIAFTDLPFNLNYSDIGKLKIYWNDYEFNQKQSEIKNTSSVEEHSVISEAFLDLNSSDSGQELKEDNFVLINNESANYPLEILSSAENLTVENTLGEIEGIDYIRKEVPYDYYDLDSDGLYDYVEWVVPHLSLQRFDLLFVNYTSNLDGKITFYGDYAALKITDDSTTPYKYLTGYWPFDTYLNSSAMPDLSPLNGYAIRDGDDYLRPGLYGNAYYANSTAAMTAKYRSAQASQSLTVSFWFYPYTSDGNFKGILRGPGANGYYQGWRCGVQNTNLYCNIGNNSGTGYIGSDMWGISTLTWHYVAITYNNATSNFTAYYNGVPWSTGSQNGGIYYPSTSDLNFGNCDGCSIFNGLIDEVMMFNSSLSSQEIRDIYNNQSSRFFSTGYLEHKSVNIVNDRNSIEVLVVGGGGGGGGATYLVGGRGGGGGGAGGVKYTSSYLLNSSVINVTVGAGGTGGVNYDNSGTSGGNSTFGTLTAYGGGYGTGPYSASGGNGGSGGGAVLGGNGGLGTAGQGYDGGKGNGYGGGGGGGAGSAGLNTTTANDGAAGGSGYTYMGVNYAAGGGGGSNAGTGGAAGGASAGKGGDNSQAGANATANRGGGGGGAGMWSAGAGNGGSGVVIVRYFGSPMATGGNITYSNGYTTHTFTSSGTFAITNYSLLGENSFNLTFDDYVRYDKANITARIGQWKLDKLYENYSGLIAYYHADANANDSSGNGNNGVLMNGATVNGAGLFNKSFELDGVDDFVNVSHSSSLNVSGNLTISLWAKFNEIKNTAGCSMTLLDKTVNSGAGASNYQIGLSCNNPENISYWESAASCYGKTTGGHGISNKTWAHIVLVRAQNNITFYINGVLKTTTISGGCTTYPQEGNTGSLTIGADGGTANFFNGTIDELMLFNRLLSADEIKNIYINGSAKWANSSGTYYNNTDPNLVAYYHADDTSFDSSGKGNHGTLINGASANASGVFDKAFVFDGVNDHVNISNSSLFDVQNFTISAWVYSSNFSQNGFIFEKGPVNTQYSYFFAATNNFYFRTYNSAGSGDDLSFTTSNYVTNNAWNHVVAIYNGTAKAVYVNGVLAASKSYSQTLRTGQLGQTIGAYGGGGYFFNGSIDEVIVYNRSLSANEIKDLYIKGRAKWDYSPFQQLNDVSTTYNYRASSGIKLCLIDNQTDVCGTNGNGVLNGNAAYISVPEAIRNKSLYVDGAGDYINFTSPTTNLSGSSFTVSLWAKRNSTGTFQGMFWQGREATRESLLLAFRDSSYVTCAFYSDDLDSPIAYTDSDWHMWTCTYNSANGNNNRTLYKDGVPVASDAPTGGSGAMKGSGPIRIGKYSASAALEFNGSIDDVALWNRSLTDFEVKELYLNSKQYHSSNKFSIDPQTSVILPAFNLSSGQYSFTTPYLVSSISVPGSLIGSSYLECSSGGCFVIGNRTGLSSAIFTRDGALYLRGTLTQSSVGSPDGSDFIIKNSTGSVVAWIDDATGNMRLSGTLTQGQATSCTPPTRSLIIKNSAGECVSYIDSSGNVWLKNVLVENANI